MHTQVTNMVSCWDYLVAAEKNVSGCVNFNMFQLMFSAAWKFFLGPWKKHPIWVGSGNQPSTDSSGQASHGFELCLAHELYITGSLLRDALAGLHGFLAFALLLGRGRQSYNNSLIILMWLKGNIWFRIDWIDLDWPSMTQVDKRWCQH